MSFDNRVHADLQDLLQAVKDLTKAVEALAPASLEPITEQKQDQAQSPTPHELFDWLKEHPGESADVSGVAFLNTLSFIAASWGLTLSVSSLRSYPPSWRVTIA